MVYDVIVLGGGPAGLTAALYCSRGGLSTLVIAGQPSGGQLTLTTDVENFPGFPEGVQGPKLIQLMRKQTERFGSTFVDENVISITGNSNNTFLLKTDRNTEYKAKSVIICTGASARWLGIENEQRLRGRGVSACATCDGFFFKNKVVAVVGGGDAAMEESIFLTKFASKVYVIVRSDKKSMRASKFMQNKAFSNSKIELVFNSEIIDVLGKDAVEGLMIKNSLSGEKIRMDNINGLFVAIGHKPNTDFLTGFLELGKQGYIVVHENTKTSVEGVFVGGDVSDYKYRQAVTAAGLGCMAALDAQKFLDEKKN